jgi:polysaccharide pyruvyl transferase WcaK-like protein
MHFDRSFEGLVEFVSVLLRMHYRVLLFQSDDPDKTVVARLFETLKKEELPDLNGLLTSPSIQTLDDLVLHLSSVDFVVASRLHGILLAHLLNKPALAVSYDRKVDSYMLDMNQEQFCVDIHQFDATDLAGKFSSLLANSVAIRNQLAFKTERYRQSLTHQYQNLFSSNNSFSNV